MADRPPGTSPQRPADAPGVPDLPARVTGSVVSELCPGRYPEHEQVIFDAAVFAAVEDALSADGPFDPERFDPSACGRASEVPVRELTIYEYGVLTVAGITRPTVGAEPALRSYVTDSHHHKRS